MPDGPGGDSRRLRGLLVDLEPLRRDRDFRLLWLGQLVSGTGRQVTVVALPYLLYVRTGTTLSVGLLALVQLVPILAFALGGGAVADAVDRRRLLLITQLGLACTSLALVVLALLPDPPLAAFYAVAFVAAGLGAVDQPARSSAIPRLVPRERLTGAIALNQLGFQAVAVAGSRPRRRPHRDRRRPRRLRRRRAQLRRRDRRAPAHGTDPAPARGGPAEPRLDRGGAALRPGPADRPGDVRHRPRRDDLRDAELALPGARPRRVPGRPGRGRVAGGGTCRRRARRSGPDRLDRPGPAAGTCRLRGGRGLGPRDRRLRAAGRRASRSPSCASRSPAQPT